MIRKIHLSISVSLLLILSSCDRNVNEVNEVVSWPEINDFDNISFKADGLVRVKDLESVRQLKEELVKSGLSVTTESIPSNAANPEEVELLVKDLNNIVSSLTKDNIDDSSLENLILGLHPVIAKIIDA